VENCWRHKIIPSWSRTRPWRCSSIDFRSSGDRTRAHY